MKQPKSVRFPEQLDRKLERAAKKSNTPESDLIRLAVAQFLQAHKSADAIIEAVVRSRQQEVS